MGLLQTLFILVANEELRVRSSGFWSLEYGRSHVYKRVSTVGKRACGWRVWVCLRTSRQNRNRGKIPEEGVTGSGIGRVVDVQWEGIHDSPYDPGDPRKSWDVWGSFTWESFPEPLSLCFYLYSSVTVTSGKDLHTSQSPDRQKWS